ncbi:MAG: rRNA maturation RNase YbeY [Candidatus Glassbacteria bacterium]|nr:rRNA maturation RNase YbeY [Candidatus Glassbacteria bacterium]
MPAGLHTPLKTMIVSLLESRQVARAEISLTFVGAEMIRRLNREYLGSDRETDVISFDLSGEGDAGVKSRGAKTPLVGDVYICVPRAVKQAAAYAVPVQEELLRLAAHGVLHLLGYDHRNEAESREMDRLQERLVGRYRPGSAG